MLHSNYTRALKTCSLLVSFKWESVASFCYKWCNVSLYAPTQITWQNFRFAKSQIFLIVLTFSMETKSFKKVLKNNIINIFVGKFDDFNEKTGIIILTDFSANYSRNLEHQMCVTMYIVLTYFLQTDLLCMCMYCHCLTVKSRTWQRKKYLRMSTYYCLCM